ncbi:uncharacterized protein LOC141621966 [Silene latifolia]|uniref:uncharacterized protein LOC141621966 n=1 Tax=Silene latifolia TaxID=37657 RepID=UPI003D76D624
MASTRFIILIICTLLVSAEQSPKLSLTDINVLAIIKDTLIDLPGSTFFSTWDFTAPDPCSSFTGLTCALSPPSSDTLRVTTLELGTGVSGTLGLAGTLPEAITELTELTQLILNPGLVTGPIPTQLGRLKNLRVIFLSHNRLTGPIPSSLVELTQLHTIDFSFNRLTGPIPPSLLTDIPNLKILILASNQLTGNIPDTSTSPNSLFHLDLKCNRLVGPIPTTLPLTLRYVSLSQNLMWGPINGSILKALPDLSYLDLSYNQFSGSLPTSFFRPTLSTLLLNHNNFSGIVSSDSDTDTISRSPAPYPEGAAVDLSHNGFYGRLPDAVAGAENIFLNNNRFSGPVPDVYAYGVKDGRIKTLYLQHNFLDKFPKNVGPSLPDNVEVCLAYNCMVPPLGLDLCPTSVDGKVSRPATQCSVFHNG